MDKNCMACDKRFGIFRPLLRFRDENNMPLFLCPECYEKLTVEEKNRLQRYKSK